MADNNSLTEKRTMRGSGNANDRREQILPADFKGGQ